MHLASVAVTSFGRDFAIAVFLVAVLDIGVSAIVRKYFPQRAWLAMLAGSSLFMALVWLSISVAAIFGAGDNPDVTDSERNVAQSTFGLVFKLCDLFPGSPGASTSQVCPIWLPLPFLTAIFFAIGLLPAAFTALKSRAERSGGK